MFILCNYFVVNLFKVLHNNTITSIESITFEKLPKLQELYVLKERKIKENRRSLRHYNILF